MINKLVIQSKQKKKVSTSTKKLSQFKISQDFLSEIQQQNVAFSYKFSNVSIVSDTFISQVCQTSKPYNRCFLYFKLTNFLKIFNNGLRCFQSIPALQSLDKISNFKHFDNFKMLFLKMRHVFKSIQIPSFLASNSYNVYSLKHSSFSGKFICLRLLF